MQSATFREWLTERGCHFRQHERAHGHVIVEIAREGRLAELPMASSHQQLDPDLVRDICDRLGLDWNQLPGPQSRV